MPRAVPDKGAGRKTAQNRPGAARSGPSVLERDALAMAPFGTPGLAELGLTDPDFADLEHLGPVAVEQAVARWGEVREFLAREKLSGLAADIAALDGPARDRLIEGLLAALTTERTAQDGR